MLTGTFSLWHRSFSRGLKVREALFPSEVPGPHVGQAWRRWNFLCQLQSFPTSSLQRTSQRVSLEREGWLEAESIYPCCPSTGEGEQQPPLTSRWTRTSRRAFLLPVSVWGNVRMGWRSGGQCNPVPEGRNKGVWFPWTWWGSWAGKTSLKETPPKRAAWGRLTKAPSRKKWTAGKPEAEGYCNPFPNLTVKTTRINKYKHKVDI